MTGAAKVLLEGGDLDRLEELFEVYETSRNQENETDLDFMRSVASMISILLQLGSQVDNQVDNPNNIRVTRCPL